MAFTKMIPSTKVPVVILGAGLSGLTATQSLSDGHLIIEKESQSGGMARTVEKDGYRFDYTGHLLHLHEPVMVKWLTELLGKNLKCIERKAWIRSHDTYSRYPFQVNTFPLPQWVKDECVLEFQKALRVPPGRITVRQPFSEWVMSTFGKGFAKHFFFPYNQKLWTVPPDKLTCEWVVPFVPRPNLDEVVRGATTDCKEEFGYNARFNYPLHGGIQSLVNAYIKTRRPNVEYNTQVFTVDVAEHIVTTLNRLTGVKRTIEYDHLVSTIPLPELAKCVSVLSNNLSRHVDKLRWTSVMCFNIGVRRENVGDGKHWVYFPESQYPFYRVGFYHNIAKSLVPKGRSSMYVECSVSPDVSLTPTKKADMLFACLDGLRDCGLIENSNEIETVVDMHIPYAYVIYDVNRTAAVTELISFFNSRDVHCIGRYGSWKYSFMESDMMEALMLSEKLKGGLSYDIDRSN